MDTVAKGLNYKLVAIGLVVFLLTSIAIYWFLFRKKSEEGLENPDGSKSGESTAEVIFFYTAWCPYCKKARPEWDKFKQRWNEQSLSGTTVLIREVDCDKDEPTANKYEITGYPTIKCIFNKKIAEFDGTINAESLELFLKTCVE
jgi:thiol-disulfide isomerase/thioredoxin